MDIVGVIVHDAGRVRDPWRDRRWVALCGLLVLHLHFNLSGLARADPPAPTPRVGPAPPPSPLAPPGEAAAMAERPFGRATYRPGGGLTVRLQDGRFALGVFMWAQLQFAAKHDRVHASGAPPTSATLELRRARLVLQGHAFSPHLKFYAHLMFSPKDLGFKDGVATRAPACSRTSRRRTSSAPGGQS